jgi:hypothetical protein
MLREVHGSQVSGDDANAEEQEPQCDKWYAGEKYVRQVVEQESTKDKRDKNRCWSRQECVEGLINPVIENIVIHRVPVPPEGGE